MNEQQNEKLEIKTLQYYYRVEEENEFQPFHPIQNNKVINLIHALVSETEKQGSFYNRFKDVLKLHIYLWSEEEMKMSLIKTIPFNKLNGTLQKGA